MMAKLSYSAARTIRDSYAAGQTVTQLAITFDVSPTTVYEVLKNTRYRTAVSSSTHNGSSSANVHPPGNLPSRWNLDVELTEEQFNDLPSEEKIKYAHQRMLRGERLTAAVEGGRASGHETADRETAEISPEVQEQAKRLLGQS
jgi:DNA invertase Pin-like site-specific DNA recombinase